MTLTLVRAMSRRRSTPMTSARPFGRMPKLAAVEVSTATLTPGLNGGAGGRHHDEGKLGEGQLNTRDVRQRHDGGGLVKRCSGHVDRGGEGNDCTCERWRHAELFNGGFHCQRHDRCGIGC